MEQQSPGGNSVPELNDDDLEFKPVVKYAAIGLAVVALLGVEYATYRVGYGRGFNDGVTSEVVSEAVNTAAVENLTHFMQAATADDATLLQTVKERKTGLAWIKNPDIRREAEWTLAVALMNRDKVSAAADMLSELFATESPTEIWARRALITARAMAKEEQSKAALNYYRYAAKAYGKLQRPDEQLSIYSELAELIASSSASAEQQLKALATLREHVAALGDKGRFLLSNIYAYEGRTHRAHGNREEALRCFELALQGADLSKTPALAGAAVSMGSALLEKGDMERAATLLRDGVNRLGEHPGDATYLAMALRDLARIEQEQGQQENALALLYRAEGAAMGRIAEDNPYWPYLYDQRGWVNLTKEAWEAALADFSRALACTSVAEEKRALPLEGAGRCCITLGKVDDAQRYLQESLTLRNRYFAGDKPAIGRVCFMLAQAYDMAGKTREAAEAYGRAAESLPEPAEGEAAEESARFNALMGRAYALSQLHDWKAAIVAWDALRPYVVRGSHRAFEVEAQFALCRRHGANLPEDIDDEEAAEAGSEEH
ncbi:MAG: tetratricopeptide repeat protein [Akkermansia sp.]|nr:tetratricopeptide repeat protein [Akkermansia sp.]